MSARTSLAGQRAVVVGFDGYQELHVWYPVLRLRELGADVTLAGAATADAVSGALRYPLLPNAPVAEVAPDGVRVVVIPGGPGVAAAARQQPLAAFVAKAHAGGALVAAIGEGTAVLDAAGVRAGDARVLTAPDADAIPGLFQQIVSKA